MKALLALLMIGLAVTGAQAQPTTVGAGDDVIAVVLGKKITAKDKDRLDGKILWTLLDKFAEDHRIAVTEQEVDTVIRRIKDIEQQRLRQLEQHRKNLMAQLQAGTLSAQDRQKKEAELANFDDILREVDKSTRYIQRMEDQLRETQRRTARQFVRQWKINKALYAKYGGRVAFQQSGPEPIDAYRDFLKEQQRAGAFRILDPKYDPPFWRYFTNDAIHKFYEGDDGARYINTPWWMMEEPAKK
ncbi:MAG: SurA N-terminal domain-containing protein [Alphaproteobacteria bacterium]|nr:SurA N-terminal domain-containing protein [Alphaproteobacteria bacterium]